MVYPNYTLHIIFKKFKGFKKSQARGLHKDIKQSNKQRIQNELKPELGIMVDFALAWQF